MQPPAELSVAAVPVGVLPVVVGVDGSPSSTSALDLAAVEAALRELALRIVYVREPPDRWHTVGRRCPTLVDPDLVLAESRQRVVDRHPRLAVEAQLVDGLPSMMLIEQSGQACLTVVGHQGGGGFLGLAAGSVCIQLATRGHGPVIVVRGATANSGEAPVVVGVDAGDPAPEAIEFGFVEAGLRRVALHAVYVWSPPSDGLDREKAEEAAGMLADVIAALSERYPDVKVERLTDRSPDPPAAILVASRGAGLVVLGQHGESAPDRLVLGSVGDTLLHHSRCPVAVVHV
jgi:nucleotide-binding universal stress UspA family protein